MDINDITLAELAAKTTLDEEQYIEIIKSEFRLDVAADTTLKDIPEHMHRTIGIITWAHTPESKG